MRSRIKKCKINAMPNYITIKINTLYAIEKNVDSYRKREKSSQQQQHQRRQEREKKRISLIAERNTMA